MHRFDQPGDQRVEEPRPIVWLVCPTQPPADAARPCVLADALAFRTGAVKRDEHAGAFELARQALGESSKRRVTAVVWDRHRVSRQEPAVRDGVDDMARPSL